MPVIDSFPTPEVPFYAVIFTSRLASVHEGYEQIAARMVELAREQPEFLGMDPVRDGVIGITVSYVESLAAIRNWGCHPEHLEAQRQGRESWYEQYSVRVARVERERYVPPTIG